MMTRPFFLLAIALAFCTCVNAQNDKKYWRDGKLTWEDFRERQTEQGVSAFKYFLGYNSEKQKLGDTTVVRIVATCYMDKSLSWVHPDYKTAQILQYNQVLFDIVELYRRKLQYELDRTNSVLLMESTFRTLYSACAREVDEFERKSQRGQNTDVIYAWKKKTDDALSETSDSPIPSLSPRNFGYGMHLGIGAGMFAGALGDHFRPTFNFVYGFDFAYKRSILFLSATLAGGKVKRDYLSEGNWYEGQTVHVAILDVSYGYAIIDNADLRITPFAGLGVTEFSRKDKSNQEDITMVDPNLLFGINADYKIRTRLNLVPGLFNGLREKVETCVRARLYITRANYSPDLNGYSINLTVGLGGFGRFLRFDR